MSGNINSIWLAKKGGKLHPAILSRLTMWEEESNQNNFRIVLWTNLNEIDRENIEILKANNIFVKDHSECSHSSLYKYFLFFLNKGIDSDITAFALASDILRMAILELTDPEEYFIYADANDVEFINLKENLQSDIDQGKESAQKTEESNKNYSDNYKDSTSFMNKYNSAKLR